MTDRSALTQCGRFAACIVAAGLLFAPAASAQTQLPPPAQFGGADQRQDRIEELEGQLREQTAENERLQFELTQAQREITRLRNMVGELAGVNQSLSEGQPPAAENNGAVAPPPPAAAQQGANAAQQRATGTLGTIPAADAPVEPGPAYTRARELLVNGRYAEAEVAFGDFLQRFPNAETAADARFWYGFTLLARNNFADAAASFVEYLQRTPQGPRAPEAQVRLGMALVGMNQRQQGCAAFAALPRRYPNAPRNVRDLALREARAASCAA